MLYFCKIKKVIHKNKMENKNLKLPLFYKNNNVQGFFHKPNKIIKVEIPKGFFNCGVSICNHFIADTNNSTDWRTLKFPLPKPLGKRWEILQYDNVNEEKTIVELISRGWL